MLLARSAVNSHIVAIPFAVFISCLALSARSEDADGPVIALQQEPNGLSSIFDSMMAGRVIQGAIARGLVEMDDEWNYHPVLCKEIPSFDNKLWAVEKNPDGSVRAMTVTWRLREGIKWEDGEPITSHDFKFAWQVVMTSDEVVSRDVARRIENIDDSDPQTVIVRWKGPYAYANLEISGLLPAHRLEEEFKRNPKEFHNHNFRLTPLARGPYRLTEWKKGEYIRLDANPNWWGSPPLIKRLHFKFVEEQANIVEELESGRIDAVSTVGLSVEQANELKRNQVDDFEVSYVTGLAWEHIDFNFDNKILNPPGNPDEGKKVRQALLYSIDRHAINQEIFDGSYTIANSWLPEKHNGYNHSVKIYPYDPVRAASLLEEVGWTLKTGAEFRTNAKGEELALTLSTTAGNKGREAVESALQNYWRKIGIRVSIENQPAKTFFAELMHKRKYKAMGLYGWIFGPTSDGERIWTSKNIPHEGNQWQGQNYSGFRNGLVDRINTEIPNTLEEAGRVELFHRQQDIWTEELPSLPLFFRTTISVYRKGWENWQPTGTNQPETWNAETWNHPNWK